MSCRVPDADGAVYVARISLISGEHRLPACCRRQLADDSNQWREFLVVHVRWAFRQAAEKDRFATANSSCGGLAACAPQRSNMPATSPCTKRVVTTNSRDDQVRSSSRRLHRRNVAVARRKLRSCGDVSAVQSRCSLSKIFRPAGSTIVFAMVPQMG